MTHVNNLLFCVLLGMGEETLSGLLPAGQLDTLTAQFAAVTPLGIAAGLLERFSAVLFHLFATSLVFLAVAQAEMAAACPAGHPVPITLLLRCPAGWPLAHGAPPLRPSAGMRRSLLAEQAVVPPEQGRIDPQKRPSLRDGPFLRPFGRGYFSKGWQFSSRPLPAARCRCCPPGRFSGTPWAPAWRGRTPPHS